jgi:hypothetical protein
MRNMATAALCIICGAIFAAADADATFSTIMFTATTRAAPIVHETAGSLELTFVHDIDPRGHDFAAVAATVDGRSVGSRESHTVGAPPGAAVLVHAKAGAVSPQVTTISFDKLPLKEVASVKFFVFSQTGDEEYVVHLPASFEGMKPPAGPLVLFVNKAGPSELTTSSGLHIRGGLSMDWSNSGGVITDARMPGATVTDSDGHEILQASVDIQYTAQAATLPATGR